MTQKEPQITVRERAREMLKEEFRREHAEKFNESQEWLFELVADYWLGKITLALEEKMKEVEKIYKHKGDYSDEFMEQIHGGVVNDTLDKVIKILKQ